MLCAADLVTGGSGFSAAAGVVLWKVRLPRMLTALLAGAALSLSGAQMQAIFRNPLADPHIMGISGGAGLGAAIATLCVGTSVSWFTGTTVLGAAFMGALLSGGLIIAVARHFDGVLPLLLFGVLLGFVCSAVSSILQYAAAEESLKLFYSWMSGSFGTTRYREILLMGAALLAGGALAFRESKGLDLLYFGDAFARAAGAPTDRIRRRALLGSCLMTGVVTACCGPIGFVGIVGPHLGRTASGSAVHRQMLPATLLAGASLTLLADILAGCWPMPLPAGSTIALIGIPLILAGCLRHPV